jgi:hypothetical protein
MTKDEALKLINIHDETGNIEDLVIAYNACKEALEQPDRPANAVLVPEDKLKKMQEELKDLRSQSKKWQGFARRTS